MFTKDEYGLTDSFLECPYDAVLEWSPEPAFAKEDIWNVLKTESLTLDLFGLIYAFITEGKWLVQSTDDEGNRLLDEESVTGQGMWGSSGKKSPQAIFEKGVETFWPNLTAGPDAYTIWNFKESVSIHHFRVRAEEYSDYGHFASEIYLYCGMDEKHQSYDYGIALKTRKCAGWQTFEWVNDHNPMKGKYWRIIIHKTHQENCYAEIAQVDMMGFVCD